MGHSGAVLSTSLSTSVSSVFTVPCRECVPVSPSSGLLDNRETLDEDNAILHSYCLIVVCSLKKIVGFGDKLHFVGLITLQEQFFFSSHI